MIFREIELEEVGQGNNIEEPRLSTDLRSRSALASR